MSPSLRHNRENKPHESDSSIFRLAVLCKRKTTKLKLSTAMVRKRIDKGVLFLYGVSAYFRYSSLLVEAKQRGIVIDWTTLYEEFLSRPDTADLRSLPYMEGDHWIDAVERMIEVG